MPRTRPTVKEINRLQAEIDYLRTQDPGKELTRLQALVDSMEAANIRRQGIIDSFNEQRAKDAEGCRKLKQRIRELEDRLSTYEIDKQVADEGPEVRDYSLVDPDLLEELAIAVLKGEDYEDLEERCEAAATFYPHSQQQIVIDDKGVRRFRRNKLVDRLVDESGPGKVSAGSGLNYAFSIEASREDLAQLAQLLGYSVDGYQSLSYALPLKDE